MVQDLLCEKPLDVPIAYLPTSMVRAGRSFLSDGELLLLCFYLSRQKQTEYRGGPGYEYVFKQNNKDVMLIFYKPWKLAMHLGCSKTTAWRWHNGLVTKQLIEEIFDPTMMYAIPQGLGKTYVMKSGESTCVSLVRWDDPTFTPAMRRLWIILHSYTSGEENSLNWPTQKTLAQDIGCHPRKISDGISKLKQAGLISKIPN